MDAPERHSGMRRAGKPAPASTGTLLPA
jgi:hypothetical protein